MSKKDFMEIADKIGWNSLTHAEAMRTVDIIIPALSSLSPSFDHSTFRAYVSDKFAFYEGARNRWE